MCTPAASLAMQAGGAVQSSLGAYFAAAGQKRSLYGQASMDDIAASVADDNARNALYAGNVEESRIKLFGAQTKSATNARLASSGVDIANSPTALARLTGDDAITFVDANTARANALRAAWGQRFDAGNARRAAVSARASADGISPVMAGVTSLISGAGQVAQSWYTMNKEGAFASAPRVGHAKVDAGSSDDLLSNWPGINQGDFRRGSGGLSYGRGY